MVGLGANRPLAGRQHHKRLNLSVSVENQWFREFTTVLKPCFPFSGCREASGIVMSPGKSGRFPQHREGRLFLETCNDLQKFMHKLCLLKGQLDGEVGRLISAGLCGF